MMPCGAGQRTPVAPDSPDSVAESVFRRVNDYRKDRGLAPLQLNDGLSRIALDHSSRMAAGRRRPGHSGFDERADAIERMFRCRAIAENVAAVDGKAGSDPAARAVEMWLRSSGHRRLILGRYDLTGIGVARDKRGGYHLTQIFVERARPR
jgi:uncharacterized protein YkwD